MTEPAAVALSRWDAVQIDRTLYEEYVAFTADPAHTWRESSTEQHLTVSAFIFNRDLNRVLLCFHKKGQFWLQLGGHIEQQDTSIFEAAEREAAEESGLSALCPISTDPVDLSRHELSSGFGTCRVHWDVGFAFTTDVIEEIVVSDESEDLRWYPVAELPAPLADGVAHRIAAIRAASSR